MFVTSSPELFDEYARRQFVARAPKQNPFGTDEMPAAFNEFDAFTKVCASHARQPFMMQCQPYSHPTGRKIRVLQQLTQWAMINPARIRERMEEQRDVDQASWVGISYPLFKALYQADHPILRE